MRFFAIGVGLLVPSVALACGGFFMGDLRPVEQSSERVLIVMHGDGTLTAVLEHGYVGSPQDFAWVLPVPETPELEVVPETVLRFLDEATKPILTPPRGDCPAERQSSGCNDRLGASKGEFVASGSDSRGVSVEELPRVGPYDADVVSAPDVDQLTTFLTGSGYVVPAEVEPYMAHYVDAGAKFLVVRLVPGASVRNIAPLGLTLHTTTPVVPLALTVTAAEPRMGVAVVIVADTPFRAQNWQNLHIAADDVRADLHSHQTNYEALVSQRVDAAGGEAFVLESVTLAADVREVVDGIWAGDSNDVDLSRSYLDDLLTDDLVVTRLYTRLVPWAITSDPAFEPDPDGVLASRVIDLSTQRAQSMCNGTPRRTPCLEFYCGADAQCASTDSGDACVCPPGEVARRVGPSDHYTVTCAPADFDFTGSLDGLSDPCVGSVCGEHGACVAQSGFAACTCESGYAYAGHEGCRPIIKAYGAEQLLTQPGVPVEEPDEGCAAAPLGGASLFLLVVLKLARLGFSRRRAI